ncbi:MAG TPA: chemotaxis protein CheW, partial [Lachnospiraceae bacterium]|nr:chemotaxis protein CheW [Lachnospiraceae bacterium]
VIKIGDEQYGIDIKYVENIVRMQKITRVPKVQKYFKGVINLRGEVVPVMSLRLKMNLAEDETMNKTRIIIIKLEANAPVGIIVDEVKEVVTLDDSCIEVVSRKAKSEEVSYINGI